MSDEPTERDVEQLARVIRGFGPGDKAGNGRARTVLASDWYRERIADARREGAAEALDKANGLDPPQRPLRGDA